MFDKATSLAVLACMKDSLGWGLDESQGEASTEHYELLLSQVTRSDAEVDEALREVLWKLGLFYGKEVERQWIDKSQLVD